MKKKGLALSLLLTALIAVAWWRREGTAPVAPAPLPAQAKRAEAIPPAAKPPRAFQWPQGARQTYHYQLSTQLRVNTTVTSPHAQWQEIPLELDGMLNLRVFAREQDKVYVGFQLAPLKVTHNGQTVPLMERLYGVFFMAALSPRGRFLDFYFPAYLSSEEERVPLSELVKPAQTVLPAGEAPPVWETEETHASGTYRAAYRWTQDGLEKRKSAYTQVSMMTPAAASGLTLTGKVRASKGDIQLSQTHAWLENLSLDESAVFSSQYGPLTEAHYQLLLQRTETAPQANLDIWTAPDTPAQVQTHLASLSTLPEGGGIWDAMRREQLRQAYAGLAVQDVLTDLTLADSPETRAPLARRLQEYLSAYPEATPEVVKQLQQTLYPADISGAVISVLENLGHLPAQQALLELLTDQRPEADYQVMQAAIAAGGVKQPAPILVDGLWRRVNEGGREYDTALLSLGRLSAALDETGDTSGAEEIRQGLSAYLQQDGLSARDQMLLLKSLANAASPDVYPLLSDYLHAEDVSVRAAAHQVLRTYDDSDSRAVLLDSLNHDKAVPVRSAALTSLTTRADQDSPDTLNAVAQALPREADESLRTGMIRFLGRHKDAEPSVTQVLRQQLARETEREMLKEVYKALY